MAIIKLKRGNKASLPTTANIGEPLLSMDTGELFYGDSAGNRQAVKVDKTNVLLGSDLFLTAADKAKLDGITPSADSVSDSATNGNILVNGAEVEVYSHPSTHPASMITAAVSGITGSEVATILSNLKNYIDSTVNGMDVKASCRVVSTTNITLSGLLTIDGVTLVAGDRVLVIGQTTASQNGIYIAASGAWTRAADCNSGVTSGLFTYIEEGTSYGNTGWMLTTDNPITIGTTALTFTQITGLGQVTAGTGLTKSGNIISIANTGVTAGTYTKVTVNSQGQATAGSSLSAADIPSLDTSKITTGFFPIERGGTNNNAFTSGELLKFDGSKIASSGSTPASFAPASHVGSGGTAHANATPSVAGFMSSSDKAKLDGVAAGANNYTHPTGDGNLHVPATGTTNYGKVLTAGGNAGEIYWSPAMSSINIHGNGQADVGMWWDWANDLTFSTEFFVEVPYQGSPDVTVRLNIIDGGSF